MCGMSSQKPFDIKYTMNNVYKIPVKSQQGLWGMDLTLFYTSLMFLIREHYRWWNMCWSVALQASEDPPSVNTKLPGKANMHTL